MKLLDGFGKYSIIYSHSLVKSEGTRNYKHSEGFGDSTLAGAAVLALTKPVS